MTMRTPERKVRFFSLPHGRLLHSIRVRASRLFVTSRPVTRMPARVGRANSVASAATDGVPGFLGFGTTGPGPGVGVTGFGFCGGVTGAGVGAGAGVRAGVTTGAGVGTAAAATPVAESSAYGGSDASLTT